MSNRLLHVNFVMLGSTAVTAASEQLSNPAVNLQDQQRQKTYRSKVGWTIGTDNNKLDLFRGGGGPGNFTITITSGYYATGAALATEITARLEAADAPPTWEVTYSSTTNKFRFRDAAGAPVNFNLLWSSGANAAFSAGTDLGFDVSADDTGTSDYTGDFAVYQSRAYIRVNSVGAAVTAFAILGHNFTVLTSVKLQGNSSDSWSAPPLNTTYSTVFEDPRVEFFSVQSRDWFRIVIDNTRNSVGFTEVGIIYLGTYLTPSVCLTDGEEDQVEDFSTIEYSIAGSAYLDQHPERDVWVLAWTQLASSDKGLVDTLFDAMTVGKHWILTWNHASPSAAGDGVNGSTYGFLPSPRRKQGNAAGNYWTYNFAFAEAL